MDVAKKSKAELVKMLMTTRAEERLRIAKMVSVDAQALYDKAVALDAEGQESDAVSTMAISITLRSVAMGIHNLGDA